MQSVLNQTAKAECYDMSVKELAQYLTIPDRAAYRLLDEGKINYRKPAGIISVDRIDAQRYLDEHTYRATHPLRRQAA